VSRSSSRRGLGFVVVLLVVLGVVVDLMRYDSFILGLVNGDPPEGTQFERTIDRVRRTRPRFERPNSMRSDPSRSGGSISASHAHLG
jgi:hypothetical protein